MNEKWITKPIGPDALDDLNALFEVFDESIRADQNYRREWQCLTESEYAAIEMERFFDESCGVGDDDDSEKKI